MDHYPARPHPQGDRQGLAAIPYHDTRWIAFDNPTWGPGRIMVGDGSETLAVALEEEGSNTRR